MGPVSPAIPQTQQGYRAALRILTDNALNHLMSEGNPIPDTKTIHTHLVALLQAVHNALPNHNTDKPEAGKLLTQAAHRDSFFYRALNAMDVLYLATQQSTDLGTFMEDAKITLEAVRLILYPTEAADIARIANDREVLSVDPISYPTERLWLAALACDPQNQPLCRAAITSIEATARVQLLGMQHLLNDADAMHKAVTEAKSDAVLVAAATSEGATLDTMTKAIKEFTTADGQWLVIEHAFTQIPHQPSETFLSNEPLLPIEIGGIKYGKSEKVQVLAYNNNPKNLEALAEHGLSEQLQLWALQQPKTDGSCTCAAVRNPKTPAVAVAALTSQHATEWTATTFLWYVRERSKWTEESKTKNLQEVLRQVVTQGGANNPHHQNILNTLYAAYDPDNGTANTATRDFNLSLLSGATPIDDLTVYNTNANAATTAIVARYAPNPDIALYALLHSYADKHTTQALVGRALAGDASITESLLQHATCNILPQEQIDKCIAALTLIHPAPTPA